MAFGNLIRNVVSAIRTAPSRIAEYTRTNPTHIEDEIIDDAVRPKQSWFKRNITDKLADVVGITSVSRAARESASRGTIIQKGQSPLNALTGEFNPKVPVNVRVQITNTGEYRNFLYNMTEREYQTFINDPDQFIQDRFEGVEKYANSPFMVVDWT